MASRERKRPEGVPQPPVAYAPGSPLSFPEGSPTCYHIQQRTPRAAGGPEGFVQPRFDSDWRRRALDGDAQAVRIFAEAMLPALYHFCLYRVGKDQHRCEEVVQETLARALRTLEQYDPERCGDNIFPWLTGLA